ncbi:MAG: HAD hydrolase-like protein [Spirochaetales bacterium]|nr:HAD hydrolase-like protein [Spirochaetales bacterium]
MTEKTYEFLHFDGTLIDYEAARYFPAYQKINLRLWEEFEKGKITTRDLRIQRFRELFEACALDADPQEMSRIYIANQAEAVFLFGDALPLLEALHSRCKLGVITNGLKEIQRKRLTLAGLDKYLDSQAGPYPALQGVLNPVKSCL